MRPRPPIASFVTPTGRVDVLPARRSSPAARRAGGIQPSVTDVTEAGAVDRAVAYLVSRGFPESWARSLPATRVLAEEAWHRREADGWVVITAGDGREMLVPLTGEMRNVHYMEVHGMASAPPLDGADPPGVYPGIDAMPRRQPGDSAANLRPRLVRAFPQMSLSLIEAIPDADVPGVYDALHDAAWVDGDTPPRWDPRGLRVEQTLRGLMDRYHVTMTNPSTPALPPSPQPICGRLSLRATQTLHMQRPWAPEDGPEPSEAVRTQANSPVYAPARVCAGQVVQDAAGNRWKVRDRPAEDGQFDVDPLPGGIAPRPPAQPPAQTSPGTSLSTTLAWGAGGVLAGLLVAYAISEATKGSAR